MNSSINTDIRHQFSIHSSFIFRLEFLGLIFSTGKWRKLQNEELNDLYYSPNIVRVIKSRRMRGAGHVARMGWGNLMEIDHLEALDADGKLILEWIFKKWDGSMDIGTDGGLL